MPFGFRNFSLGSKILLMIMSASLISLGVATWSSYQAASEALSVQARDKVTAIRASKKAQVEAFFRTLRNSFGAFGEDVAVVAAMQQFGDGFGQFGRQKPPPERKKALDDYYREAFMPVVNKIPGFEKLTAEEMAPRNDRCAEAQALFIAENPNPPGQKAKLADHAISNPYTLAHFTYHNWFRSLTSRLGLYDMMLVSPEGDIVYTVAKEPDFGTNLIDGPHSTSNLGRLFRQVMSEHRRGYVKVIDFEFYAPSGGAPAMFIATPIYSGFKLTGVLVGQVSIDEISRTMNGENSWRADGLGETGIAFIVGPQLYMRSNQRRFIENKDAFMKSARALGYPAAELDAIAAQNTTVLRYKVDIEGMRRAIAGETGFVISPNTRGRQTLQAYAPLEIPDLHWAVSADIEQDEILAPLELLKRQALIVACLLTLACTAAAIFLAARFVRPIKALMRGIQAVQAGRSDVRIEKIGEDEFGSLTDSFNGMAATIRERNEVIAAKNSAYAALLNQVFPEVVANRVRKGETQIFDTRPSASIIYASITGFSAAAEAMDDDDNIRILNEYVDAFDVVATELGVDRVKTIGEHYIAACGLLTPRLDHATYAIEFADKIAKEAERISRERRLAFDLRVSIDTGKVHAGVVGNHRFVFDVWGRPLNVARRLIHEANAGELVISKETLDQIGQRGGFVARPDIVSDALGVIVSFGRPLASQPAPPPERAAAMS